MTDQTLGQLYALASALSFAFASIGISVNQRRGYPNDGAFLSVVITVLFAFGLFVIFERGVLPSTDDPLFMEGILWFAMAGLFAMVFGRTLVFRSIKLLGVTRGTTVKKFNPFFSVFFAFLFLSELFSAWEMVGMGALAAALALLVSDKSRKYASQDPLKTHSFGATALLYLPGILACLAYAVSYIARKIGLDTLSVPAFGTFVSAVSGLLFYLLAATFSGTYRGFVFGGLKNIRPMTLGIGISMSLGQVLFFTALAYEKLSTVVVISALETFIAIFLSVVVFRLEQRPSVKQLGAACLATIGVGLVTFY